MKRTLRLTESELITLVKRIIDEQTKSETPLDLKNKNITVIVKSSPYQEVNGRVTGLIDVGNGEKEISYVLDNGDVAEFVKYDENKMEFDNYKIVKIDGKPVNAAKSPTPKPVVTTPKKKTPQLPDNILKQLREPKEQQDFVLYRFNMGYSEADEKVPLGIKILKDSIDVSDYPSGSNKLWFKRIKAKTTDGKNIILDHRCGYSYSTIAGGPFQLGLKVANPGLSDLLKSYCPLG